MKMKINYNHISTQEMITINNFKHLNFKFWKNENKNKNFVSPFSHLVLNMVNGIFGDSAEGIQLKPTQIPKKKCLAILIPSNMQSEIPFSLKDSEHFAKWI